MKRLEARPDRSSHKRVKHTSTPTSPSHFQGTSRIGTHELRNKIVSSANDPAAASQLSTRVLYERVTEIDDHDPSAFIFTCETTPLSAFSGASYRITKFDVELTGKLGQDVRAVVRQFSYLRTPQPLRLLLRGGIYTPTKDPRDAFCLSFEDGVVFKYGILDEMSFGVQPSLLPAMVYNGPAQPTTADPIAPSITHEPTPPPPLLTTENPDANSQRPSSPKTPSHPIPRSPSLVQDTNDKEVKPTERHPQCGPSAQPVHPPTLAEASIDSQGTGPSILTNEGTGGEERDVPQPLEPHVASPSPKSNTISTRVADPKQTVDKNPAPASSRASDSGATTTASNPVPNIASAPRKSEGKQRSGSGKTQRSVSGPAEDPAPQKVGKKRRRENRRGKKRQVSEGVNAVPEAGCDSEAATIPPADSNIAQPADAPGPRSASPINDGKTNNEDEQNDQVIEHHFTCVAKMMPSELAEKKHGYSPVAGFKDTVLRDRIVNVIGVVQRVDAISRARDFRADGSATWRQTMHIRDETPGRLSFTLFAADDRNDWLPGQTVQIGHSFLIRGLKSKRDADTATGYTHKWSWVTYNPDTKVFYSAANEPSSAACRVHECDECADPRTNSLSDNQAPFHFSPVHVPSDIEKAYLVTLAEWWKKEQGTVHVINMNPPKPTRIADVDLESLQHSRYKRVYVNVIIEVIATTQPKTPNIREVYVTDYTVHHELYSGLRLAQILPEKGVDDLDFVLDVARAHRLIPVGFFDDHAFMAEKMRVGQFYRLRNLGIFRNHWGNLEGSVKVANGFESKDVQLLVSGSGHDDELAAFLKRREDHMESAKWQNKPTYRLEGEPVPVVVDPKRPGAVATEPDSSSLSLSRKHVLNVYTSNENGQHAEQPPKLAAPALRQGESIWDREMETPQTLAEQDEVQEGAPTERFADPAPPPSSRNNKRKGVHVSLDTEAKRAPKASSIAEMCDALDKLNRTLAFRFTARVVDYYPRNCSDFVELACTSCDAEFEKMQNRCKSHPNDEAVKRWSFQLMFEDHNGDRLAAFVVEPDASEFLGDSAPGKHETAILNGLVGKYWMPALVGNLREWRQMGGEDLRGNQRIHGKFYDFCVVSSPVSVNGKESYVWNLVKTRLEVHNPLLDNMSEPQSQRVQLVNNTTARLF